MNTLEFINENKNLPYSQIRKILFTNYHIRSVEAIDNKDKPYRIILSSNKNPKLMELSIHQECNGLILEHDPIENSYKILCLPTKICNVMHYAHIGNSLKKKLCNYELYKIYDGTIINLYYYDNSWRFSTFKGYDVNEQTFYNDTYKNIFDSILSKKYKNFNYRLLNKNFSYTFCFKYQDYHVFNPYYFAPNDYIDIDDIIFLQSCNIQELNDNKKLILNEDYNLPFNVEEKEYRIQNFEQLIEICRTEYSTYNRYKCNKFRTLDYNPTFGFLLKEKRGKSENIIIYTNLYDYIKKILYMNTFNKNINQPTSIPLSLTTNRYKNGSNVIMNLALVYLLDLKINKNNNIINLFPQYKLLFLFLKKFIYEKLSVIIFNNLNNLKKNKDTINNINVENFILDPIYAPVSSQIIKLSINIYLNSYNMFDFNNKDENIFNYKSIIQDFILSEQYIIDYYDLYVEFKNNRIML